MVEMVKELWAEHGGTITGVITSATVAIGTMAFVWSKLKSFKESLSSLKSSVESKSSEVDPFKVIQMETSITDLKAKLDNPTISDSLKLQYLTQLNNLEKLLEATNTTIDSATDKVDNYTL